MLKEFLYALLFIAVSSPVEAQKDVRDLKNRWWISAGIGPGFLKTTFTQDTLNRSGKFGINVKGGHTFTKYLLTGIEINGWNLTNKSFLSFDGSRLSSASVNDLLLNTAFLMQTYPTRVPVLFKASIGWSFYMPSANNYKGSGIGVSLGTGYEHTMNKHFGLGLYLNYDFGKLTDRVITNNEFLINRKYSVINMGLNFIIY
ncbi:hypothetical protein D3C80_405300 [compost metagenome]